MDAKLIKSLREMTQAGMLDCKKALEATNDDLEQAIIWLRENGLAKAAKKIDRVAAEGITFAQTDAQGGVILEVNSETDFAAKNATFLKLVAEIAKALLQAKPKTLADALLVKLTDGQTIADAQATATATIGEKIALRRFEIFTQSTDHFLAFYNHANKRISVLLDFSGPITAEEAHNVAMHVAAMAPQYISVQEIPESFKLQEMKIIRAMSAEDPKLATKPEKVLAGIFQGKLNKKLAEISLLEQPYALDEKFKVGEFLAKKGAQINKMMRYQVGEGITKTTTDFASEVASQLNGGH